MTGDDRPRDQDRDSSWDPASARLNGPHDQDRDSSWDPASAGLNGDPGPEVFAEAFREWAQQDPRTPAAVARQRVAARIAVTRRQSPAAAWPRRLALASALALVATSGTLLWRAMPPTPAPAATVEAVPVLPDNVVQFWLDSETPVYFIVGPAGDAPGGTP